MGTASLWIGSGSGGGSTVLGDQEALYSAKKQVLSRT